MSDRNGPTTKEKSSTPIGAIVGGVVGGLAVLGLIVLGIVFILRRRGAHSPSAPTPPLTNLVPQQPPPTTPGTAHQSLYVPPHDDPSKHNSTVFATGQPPPMSQQTYGTPPPPFPAQPYPAPYPQGPMSAREYNAPTGKSTTPVSPASYQPGHGQGVHEIEDGGHRGTMSELG